MFYQGTFRWSSEDKGDLIIIENDSRIKFSGSEIHHSIIRTNKHIPETSKTFYFEAKVVESGKEGLISIGLTKTNPSTRSGYFPGWSSSLGIGYHADDGGIYYGRGQAIQHTEPYVTGDIVGCYLCCFDINNLSRTLVQFTKNGETVCSPRIIAKDKWYPTLGVGSPGATIETNFGETSFLFNTEGIYEIHTYKYF